MTRTLHGVTKEARALLPLWVASVAAVTVRAVPGVGGFDGQLPDVALLGYIVGSLALGAQSIGHEYSDRTLEILLAQPADRRRLLLTKLGVVAALLLALNAVAWSIPSNKIDLIEAWSWYGPQVLLLSALFVAPWLTMLCRSALAGMVFTGCLPGLLGTAAAVILLATRGSNGRISQDSLLFGMSAMLVVCAFGAVATWRSFMGLEAVDRRVELRLPHWMRRASRSASDARTSPGRKQNPAWMLVKKELYLQQLALVIGGLYILCWGAVALMDRFVPNFPADFPLLPLTIVYCALLSIVIGSLASAEERQFGTLEWQVLLPMPVWRQWMVKVAVVMGLALALGVGLPIVLGAIHVSEDVKAQGARLWTDRMFVFRMSTGIVVLTAVGLYLSSLSTAGVRALVLAIPVAFAGTLVLPYLAAWAPRMAYEIVMRLGRRPNLIRISPNMYYQLWSSDVPLVIGLGLAILILRFAMQNHRSAERNMSRVSRQVLGIAVYTLAGTLALTAFEVLF